MRAFLLTWNPTQWPWNYLHDSINQVAQQGYSDDHWSCGNRRDINIGDRFYLIRLGSDPRGIVASGHITSSAYDDAHWDKQRASNGDTSIYVKVRFDAITEEPIIPISELDQSPLDTFHWRSQSSGILIPIDIANIVEQLWKSRDSARQSRLPEELAACPVYIEGLGRQIVINAYERNPSARKKCLETHGYTCACCDLTLSNAYGPIADAFIHVHHLKPIAEIGESYAIDPINDLVPVCPNCHAIIHLNNPPLTVCAVRELLAAHLQTATIATEQSDPPKSPVDRDFES